MINVESIRQCIEKISPDEWQVLSGELVESTGYGGDFLCNLAIIWSLIGVPNLREGDVIDQLTANELFEDIKEPGTPLSILHALATGQTDDLFEEQLDILEVTQNK